MYSNLKSTTLYFHREPPTCTDGRNGSYMGFGPRRDRVNVNVESNESFIESIELIESKFKYSVLIIF